MMKRIVVLSSHTPSLFWFRMDMMKEFIKRGYEVYAIGNEDEKHWLHKFAEHGVIYRQIYVQRNGTNPLYDFRTIISLRSVLKKIRPNKIFSFQAKTVIYGAIAANSLGIKAVYPLIAGIGSVFINDDLKTRILRNVLVAEYRTALRKCPVVFFQNRDDEDVFRKNRIINNQKVALIHGSGVNTEHFSVLPMPNSTSFICISRLIRDKGVGEYLDACRKIKKIYPGTRCLLVGPFDTNPSAIKEDELKEYIEDGSIEYCGEIEDVRPFLRQASVFILPSYREGTPKTILEAMACGRAIITTDAPGCKETVIDGRNGFLITVKNIDELVEKMIWFFQHPYEIETMGQEGRKIAEEVFDVRKVNESICYYMQI